MSHVCFCGCREAILEHRRADAIWATDACRKRWGRDNPGKKAPTAAQRAARADRARTRRRKPITFLVIDRPVVVREIKARDRRSALRALNDLPDGAVLVAERSVAHPK